jgi:hypothetical protein
MLKLITQFKQIYISSGIHPNQGQPRSKYATAIGVPATGIDRHHYRALRHSVHERLELVGRKRLKTSRHFKEQKDQASHVNLVK